MFDLQSNYKVLGRARQSEHGLFYVEDQQDGKSQVDSDTRVDEKSMMTITRAEAAQKLPTESDDAHM